MPAEMHLGTKLKMRLQAKLCKQKSLEAKEKIPPS